MRELTDVPSWEDIGMAHVAIEGMIHKTPVITCANIDSLTGARIYFKCENFQKVGAFKMRGAACTALSLSKDAIDKGLATHSSGNHAQAVARAAQLLGTAAHIVMPENAPSIKVNAVKGYGAHVYLSGNLIQDRETKMQEVLQKTSATFIHPYNNYNIIAGQATAAKELLAQYADLDIVMAPVGGGGLLSGTALTTKYLNSGIQVIGTEPSEVDDAFRAFHSGRLETNQTINTIADGLRTMLGSYTLKIIRQFVDEIVTVSEASIIKAMHLIWERAKIVVEPSGAVPLAAVLENPNKFSNKKIGIIISGGNIDLTKLPF